MYVFVERDGILEGIVRSALLSAVVDSDYPLRTVDHIPVTGQEAAVGIYFRS